VLEKMIPDPSVDADGQVRLGKLGRRIFMTKAPEAEEEEVSGAPCYYP